MREAHARIDRAFADVEPEGSVDALLPQCAALVPVVLTARQLDAAAAVALRHGPQFAAAALRRATGGAGVEALQRHPHADGCVRTVGGRCCARSSQQRERTSRRAPTPVRALASDGDNAALIARVLGATASFDPRGVALVAALGLLTSAGPACACPTVGAASAWCLLTTLPCGAVRGQRSRSPWRASGGRSRVTCTARRARRRCAEARAASRRGGVAGVG